MELRFTRVGANPCTEDVVFEELGVKRHLAPGRTTTLKLGRLTPGKHAFRCGMGCYRGAIAVVPPPDDAVVMEERRSNTGSEATSRRRRGS